MPAGHSRSSFRYRSVGADDSALRLLIQHRLSEQLFEPGILVLKSLKSLNFCHLHTAKLLTPRIKRGIGDGVLKAVSDVTPAGHAWNHKRVHRIYCLLKLNFRRKGKQRFPVRNPAPLVVPEQLNQSWSVDFMHDALVCGRRFRTFNVVDDFNREVLTIEIDLNIPAQRVVRVLDRIVASRGFFEPKLIEKL